VRFYLKYAPHEIIQVMKILSLLCLFLSFACSICVSADARAQNNPVAAALKSAGLTADEVGIYVVPLNAKTPLLNLGAEKSFNPASTMKLVTTYAALRCSVLTLSGKPLCMPVAR
jgi:D-alanyl-D-alanine carboxypeptidase